MDTVFSHIVQKRFSRVNEDVATDALAFVLDSSGAALRGFMKLLKGIEPALPDLRFVTQQSEGNIRPDMWGMDGAQPRVFVENKFWAGLTDNQPISYLRELARCQEPTVLLAVVPDAREQTVWREFLRRLAAAQIQVAAQPAPTGIAFSALTDDGPRVGLTSWKRVLAAIEIEAVGDDRALADLGQLRALCEAADRDAFTPLSAEELSDQRLPALILNLGAIVQDSIELAVTEQLLDTRRLLPQASWDRSGRYARFTCETPVIAWIGTRFDLWRQYGATPVWTVFIDDEYGRASDVRPILEPWAAEHEIISAVDGSNFAFGIDLPVAAEKDLVVRSIVDRIREVRSALGDIPLGHNQTSPKNA